MCNLRIRLANTVKVALLLACAAAAFRLFPTSPTQSRDLQVTQPTVRFIEDISSKHGSILVVEVVEQSNRAKDGADVDDDDPNVACVEELGASRCVQESETPPRHRDRELAWPPWLALAARGPPTA
jgi:hypothetical protein